MDKLILEEELGSGSYGKVYRCKNAFGSDKAVKCIPNNKTTGLNCLFEASIMSTFDHPYINKTKRIYTADNNLYIVQDLAVTDLHNYVDKNGVPEEGLLRTWIFSIVQAIKCLHDNDIVHCDIKPDNILLYEDNTVKLNDFTLSTKDKWPNKYKISTATHRAPEVWLNRKWGKPSDIWSLGCTLFEIAYGKNVFIYQESGEDGSYINMLLDWVEHGPILGQKANFSRKNFSYASYSLPKNFDQTTMLGDLILSMLHIKPINRSTIDTILNHDYFMDMFILPYRLIESPMAKLTKRCKLYFNSVEILTDSDVRELALSIYRKLEDFTTDNELHKVKGCYWIANKMINNGTKLDKYRYHKTILDTERSICAYLSYRLL